jgi:hypothetical protein
MLCAFFLAAPLALAGEAMSQAPSPKTVTYRCLVYRPSSPEKPDFLANKRFTLADGQAEVVYEGGGLVYTIGYLIMGKGHLRFELPVVELKVKNIASHWEATVTAGVSTDWWRNLIFEPPFGLPAISCAPN